MNCKSKICSSCYCKIEIGISVALKRTHASNDCWTCVTAIAARSCDSYGVAPPDVVVQASRRQEGRGAETAEWTAVREALASPRRGEGRAAAESTPDAPQPSPPPTPAAAESGRACRRRALTRQAHESAVEWWRWRRAVGSGWGFAGGAAAGAAAFHTFRCGGAQQYDSGVDIGWRQRGLQQGRPSRRRGVLCRWRGWRRGVDLGPFATLASSVRGRRGEGGDGAPAAGR